MTVPASLSDVPDVTPYIQYVATGGQTVFPYPFPITQDADLVVVINGATQVTDSSYSVSGVGNATGGNMTLNTGATSGDIITLFRDVTIERITQIGQNSGYSSELFNFEFNNIYLILQQLEAAINQCLQVPNTNNPAPVTLLDPTAYANMYLGFDANGNPNPVALTSSGSLTQTVIAQLLNPRSASEIANGVFPPSLVYYYGDTHRYGAIADGSGVTGTDNTTAIQNALNCNNYVWNSDGSYLHDSITIPTGTWYDLRKSTMLFKAHSTSGNVAFSFGTASAGVTHSKISGGIIEGNKASQTFPSEQFSHGVRIWGSNYNEVDGCVIQNQAGDGVNIGYNTGRVVGSNGNVVKNCEVFGQVTSPQRQAIAITYGDENKILDNKCSGTIDLELNAGVGEIKNNLVRGNSGRAQTESLLTPRISDLKISLASVNTTSANYYGNIVEANTCKAIVLQYNSGTVIKNNVIIGSDSTTTYLLDIAGGADTVVSGNLFNANAAVATSLAAIIRTRASVNLNVSDNVSSGDTSGIPFHAYVLGFGAEPNASGHYFRNNQTSSGYYRNTSYPMPSEYAKFRIDQVNGGSLTATQTAGVKCTGSVSRSGTNLVLTGFGNAGTGYIFNILAPCDKANAASSNRPDMCAYTWTASGSNRTVTMFTYTPAAGAVSLSSFSFASGGGTGTFDLEVYF